MVSKQLRLAREPRDSECCGATQERLSPCSKTTRAQQTQGTKIYSTPMLQRSSASTDAPTNALSAAEKATCKRGAYDRPSALKSSSGMLRSSVSGSVAKPLLPIETFVTPPAPGKSNAPGSRQARLHLSMLLVGFQGPMVAWWRAAGAGSVSGTVPIRRVGVRLRTGSTPVACWCTVVRSTPAWLRRGHDAKQNRCLVDPWITDWHTRHWVARGGAA